MIGGTLIEVVQIGFFSLFGIYSFNATVQRYSEGRMPIWLYPVILGGGALAFWPMHLVANLSGAAIVCGCVVFTSRRGDGTREPTSTGITH